MALTSALMQQRDVCGLECCLHGASRGPEWLTQRWSACRSQHFCRQPACWEVPSTSAATAPLPPGNPTVGEWDELRPAMDAARERGLKVSLEAEVRRVQWEGCEVLSAALPTPLAGMNAGDATRPQLPSS